MSVMKSHSFILKIMASVLTFLFLTQASSFAVDKGGCLTCHRYPGLMKYEKPDHFKILHIDEETNLSTPHGTTDCRECHTQIKQIPHTGETVVDCTTRCHQNDKGKITAMINPAYFSGFHKEERFAITRLEDKTSCRVCHPLYPHSQNRKVRAFLNIHTGYLMCEVCHLKKEGLQNITFEWNEPEPFEFVGEPYGTHKKIEIPKEHGNNNFTSKMLKIFSFNGDDSGWSKQTDYLLARISVFSSADGGKKPLISTPDTVKAREFMKKEKALSSEERGKELKFFHRDIARKDISVACNDCHTANGMLNFRQIGFDDKRAKDLEYMNIKSLITKYDTFYLPHLFDH